MGFSTMDEDTALNISEAAKRAAQAAYILLSIDGSRTKASLAANAVDLLEQALSDAKDAYAELDGRK